MMSALVKSMKNAPTIGTIEEGARRGTIPLDERLHVGHRVGGGAEHEADEAARDHGGLVVAAHQPEDAEHGDDRDERELRGEDDGQRQRETGQSPTAAASSARATRNSASATLPRSSISRCDSPNSARRIVDVADDRRDQHGADVGRQR